MPAHLDIVAGKASGMTIVVDDELFIGREAEGAGQLAADEEISRSHALVTVEPSGTCSIEDLGSTNGTFVNGLRISAPQPLESGDTVELGATTLVLREMNSPRQAPAATGLRLRIDAAAGTAEVSMDGAAVPLRLVVEDGAWRAA